MRANGDNFHLLRHILALSVVLSHSFALAGAPEPAAQGLTLGGIAVHGFFVISGFLVTGSLLDSRSMLDFGWRRSLRILPALAVALLGSAVIGGWYGQFLDNPLPPDNPHPRIHNGSVWTIFWEALLYAALAGAALLRLVQPAAIAGFYAAGLLAFAAGLPAQTDFMRLVAPMLLLFLGGMHLRLHEDRLPWSGLGPLAVALLLVLFLPPLRAGVARVAGLVPFQAAPALGFDQMALLLYLVALPVAVIWFCRYLPWALPIPVDYSYGIYAYAWPVQQAVVWHLVHGLGQAQPGLVFALSLPPILLLAALSWHVLEKPALRLKALTARRTAPRLA